VAATESGPQQAVPACHLRMFLPDSAGTFDDCTCGAACLAWTAPQAMFRCQALQSTGRILSLFQQRQISSFPR
jgi:hypothetical protein